MTEFSDRRPLVFDKEGESDLIKIWERSGGTVETAGFDSALLEFKELRQNLKSINLSSEQISEALFNILKLEDLTTQNREEIRNLRVISDLAEFSRRVAEVDSYEQINSDASWILFEIEKRLVKYVPRQIHRLLQDSRSIGLRPLAVTDALRELRIKCLGLSAASPTIDLLVAAGAENITGFDAGVIDPSNLPRFVGAMASEKNLGKYKAEALAESLYGRNPYGNFDLRPGKVVMNNNDLSSDCDTTLESFVADGDIVLEVVDDVYLKSELDACLRKNELDIPVMFMADLSLPIAGINLPSMGNHFNQNISHGTLKKMADRKSGIHPLSLVSKMIGTDLPPDHVLQFALMKEGLMPYWSQLPESSRELASLSVYLIEAYLDGWNVLGKNFNIKTVPRDLMGGFGEEQLRLINKIRKNNFSF